MLRSHLVTLASVALIMSTSAFAFPTNKAFIPKGMKVDPYFLADEKSKPDFAIVGTDKRVKQFDTSSFPHTALGQLIMDGSTCSGSLIGPQHVLTAAHCIYDHDDNTFKKHVLFAPGRVDGEFHHGLYTVTDIYMPKEYAENQFSGAADVAILKLALPAGERQGWLGYAKTKPIPSATLQEINQTVFANVDASDGIQSHEDEIINSALDDLVYQYPEFKVTYMGYSGDKDDEMWADSCLYMYSGTPEGERYGLVKGFCDTQGGSSGSGYFGDDFYITSINSFHSWDGDKNFIRDADGNMTSFIRGDWDEVENYSLAINDYVYDLISQWRRDSYGEETLHHTLKPKFADYVDNFKSFSITNKCNESLYIAVRYQDLQNDWVTRGFYEKDIGEKVRFWVSSDYFYYTALGDDSNWKGEDTFVELYDKQYGLRKRTLEGKTSRNINLTCN